MASTDDASTRDPRVFLAAERTLLAWIRTGLALMGFGFVVARIAVVLPEPTMGEATRDSLLAMWGGTALVAIGVVVNVIAAVNHARFISRFNHGRPLRARPVSMGVIVSMLLASLGVVFCAYLIATR
jgi:putative membrane protein